jgi:hypothetical protein
LFSLHFFNLIGQQDSQIQSDSRKCKVNKQASLQSKAELTKKKHGRSKASLAMRLTPSLAQRQLWPDTHFGPEILRPGILRPGNTSARNNFGPENTSARLYTLARKQLRPREYFGPLIYFGPEILRPDRLRPTTLRTKLSKVSFFIIFDLP